MASLVPASVNINPSTVCVDDLIANRSGDVLIKQTLLKADHFPGCQNLKLRPLLDGAPNFRKVDGLNVYGVAIPTVSGLRNVLNEIGAASGRRKVFWHNMREEPVIYINGQPYVVREADQPFCNLEYTGIDRSRVEDMEQRLKMDILKEARLYNQQILVAHENENMQVMNVWESVTPEDVQTPMEVYAELIEDGYDVDYIRVPVTDEKAPKDSDFDLLVRRLWSTPPGAALFFNCQMGRGRTTTGMIIASLVMLRRMNAFPANGQLTSEVPDWFASCMRNEAEPAADNELSGGMFGVVRSLLRVLERGTSGKRTLDAVINACAAMQNLRTAIATYRNRIISENIERKRNVMMAVALEYLERYYMLIAFAAYLNSPMFGSASITDPTKANFAEWTSARPELRSILIRMLRRNPVNALELNAPGSTLETQDKHSEVVENRTGAVLGPHTILKEDLFPGMQSPKLPALFEGAPNFRGVDGLSVYGVGMSTIEGMRSVLRYVMSNAGEAQQKCVWFNMREEAVVYINGKPFVLREQMRPLKNMQEYGGINAIRLENMEARLKADVLAEAARNQNRLLVTCECSTAGGPRALQEQWVDVSGPEKVKTTKDVYNMLVDEGFHLVYTRVPVTDGSSPQSQDFDAILQVMCHPEHSQLPVVFNCQLGVGRTTMGMVTACLVRLFGSTGDTTPHPLNGQGALARLQYLRSPTVSSSHTDLTRLEQSDSLSLLNWEVQTALANAASAQLPGSSPASDSDSDGDRDKTDNEDSDGEEGQQVCMTQGHYVAVRRIARLLEEGDLAKKLVDNVIDACGRLVNLRMAIVRCCHRLYYRNTKPETRQRHVNFARGASYLERYCALITICSYLQRGGPAVNGPFSEWLASRTHLVEALNSIHSNPAAALAPVPQSSINQLYGTEMDVGLQEQHAVLAKRRGRTLSKRTILKTYKPEEKDPQFTLFPDLQQVDHLPIFTVGNISVEGLSRLLSHLGAGPTGRSHVIMCDVREEPAIYVNGTPYIRRELEMPAAALHHAGIHWAQLEELEAAMREDVSNELTKWGGRILLHREVPRAATPPEMSPLRNPPVLTNGNGPAAGPDTAPAAPRSALSGVDSTAIKQALSRLAPDDGVELERAAKRHKEDITTVVDLHPGNAVVAFWEPTTGRVEASNGMCTPRQVHQLLAGEGMQVSYRRIPLSRERTPVPQDLTDLYAHITRKPFSADRHTVYLILARKSTGSSARFVASAMAMYLTRLDPPVPSLRKSTTCSLGEYRGIMSLCRLLPQGLECKQAVDAAINRCSQVFAVPIPLIGNLREDIASCKRVVDSSPQTQSDNPTTPAFAARQLGLHYLKRYFLLICFRHYVSMVPPQQQSGSAQHTLPASPGSPTVLVTGRGKEQPTFTQWMDSRKELPIMLNHLTLATAT